MMLSANVHRGALFGEKENPSSSHKHSVLMKREIREQGIGEKVGILSGSHDWMTLPLRSYTHQPRVTDYGGAERVTGCQ